VDLKVNPTNNNMFQSKARRSGGGGSDRAIGAYNTTGK